MEISPIAHYHGPFSSKFGIPRQSGLTTAEGRIVFTPEFRNADALRGLDGFNYIWLIWEFSENSEAEKSLTVRPPRLGGNKRLGVFATRSPFRPNNLGLSCVMIDHIAEDPQLGPVIHVKGADLMDGTPIYDIKPYVTYADSHPEARSGFVDHSEWQELQVDIPETIGLHFSPEQLLSLKKILALDPRPHYQDDPDRVYGMPFAEYDIRFKVDGLLLSVVDCVKTVLP